jgi:hypothetical protein
VAALLRAFEVPAGAVDEGSPDEDVRAVALRSVDFDKAAVLADLIAEVYGEEADDWSFPLFIEGYSDGAAVASADELVEMVREIDALDRTALADVGGDWSKTLDAFRELFHGVASRGNSVAITLG